MYLISIYIFTPLRGRSRLQGECASVCLDLSVSVRSPQVQAHRMLMMQLPSCCLTDINNVLLRSHADKHTHMMSFLKDIKSRAF